MLRHQRNVNICFLVQICNVRVVILHALSILNSLCADYAFYFTSTTLYDALTLFSTAPHTGSAGQNKQHVVTKNTSKLDRETEELHHDRVSLEVGKVIQQGRQEKGLTQKDLATVSLHTSLILIRKT